MLRHQRTKKEGKKWSAINYLYDVLYYIGIYSSSSSITYIYYILGKQTRLIDFGRVEKKKSKFHDNFCSAGMYTLLYIYR